MRNRGRGPSIGVWAAAAAFIGGLTGLAPNRLPAETSCLDTMCDMATGACVWQPGSGTICMMGPDYRCVVRLCDQT